MRSLPAIYWLAIVAFSKWTVAAQDTNAPGSKGILENKPGGKRTLVIVDDLQVKDTHSLFLDALKTRGHQLRFALATDTSVVLTQFRDYQYDCLLLLAPKLELERGAVTVPLVQDFLEHGGNLLVAAGPQPGKAIRAIGALSGVDFDRAGSQVIDHFHAHMELEEADSAPHTVVSSRGAVDNAQLLGAFAGDGRPVLFSGVGHTVSDENILATKVLVAEDTAYSATPSKPIKGGPEGAGSNVRLVTAVQARNNARVVFAGSLAMFSNRYFQAPGYGNQLFCTELSKWALGERGVLRASHITHRREDGTAAELLLHQKERRDLPASLFPEPEIAKNSQVYRIKDNVTYSVILEEYDADRGGWGPFRANDVQMEFVMLDPFERITLNNDPATGRFYTTFKAPDEYGIFKFRILYRRVGYTVLSFSTQVSIRPFKHNEYERFIFSAGPYYAAAFSLMAGFFVFTSVFLYSADNRKTA